MFLQEPVVEFVRIDPEIVTTSSTDCDPDNPQNCGDDPYLVSGVVLCSCSDHVYGHIPDDF